LEARKRLEEFKPGDQVRKQLDRNKFAKGTVRWSKEVFTVKAIVDNHVVLNDDTNFQYYNLQKIAEVLHKANGETDQERETTKKEKKSVRDFSKEGIDPLEAFDGTQYVGRKISKKFGKKTYVGQVVEYKKPAKGDGSVGYNWVVKYSDSDEETMSLKEMKQYEI
jgi:hypothetical protein